MSANAQESSIAAAVGTVPAPDAAISKSDGEQTSAQTAGGPISSAAEPNFRHWMVLGYLSIVLGSVLLFVMPFFRLSPGLAEAGVTLTAIVLVIAGAWLAVWSFVLPMLRR